ncbi:hypothetical protein ACRYCC_38560 [Actinomadura scrupuli]|uniref:hypothetical protein n=1 Tax=Actinomadura scrupuli TaxID=559629 RepID=UPI003D989C92
MRRHTLTAAAVTAVLAFGLSACAPDGGKNPTGGRSPAARAAEQAKLIKYAQCMRSNGVDMPDPEPGGGLKMEQRGGDETVKQKTDAAQQKCRHLLPNGGQPPKLSPADVAKMREFAKCMRRHGVNMEDPGADGLIRVKETAGPGSTTRMNDKDAEQACAKLRPALEEKG